MNQVKYVNNQAALKVWVTIECIECGGEGKIEVGPECGMPASQCCGGCYKSETCDTCDGSGNITYSLDAEAIGELVKAVHFEELQDAQIVLTECL